MLKLEPTLKHYLWGGNRLKTLFGRSSDEEKVAESWEVSVHPDGLSRTEGGTLASYLAAHPHATNAQGGAFPVLIKYIDAKQNLSVQVHPGDEYARRVEGDNGKTEMWYIVEADEGAGIYCGFKRDTRKEEFVKKVQDGTVEELLNFIPVKKGECYLIKAGTLHAICAGCVICEVQESSNVTYRVYDYNRRDAAGNLRPLHLEKALDVINFSAYKDETNSGRAVKVLGGSVKKLTECAYFSCRELKLEGEFTERNDKSFVAVNVLEGCGTINGLPFERGDSFFIPCGEKYTLKGSGKMILTTQPARNYYAGIDIGGTFVKIGIVDDGGNLVAKDKIETGKERPYREIIEDIGNAVNALSVRAGVKLAGAGVGAPGTIDSENGVLVYNNNMHWKDVPLSAELEKHIHVPVKITNDANAAALGEAYAGAGKAYRSLVLLTLGTGVGSGVIIDGKLYEGGRSAGTELGHTLLKYGGKKCTCGRKGCFEVYASATALIAETKQAMLKDRGSLLWELCQGNADNADGKTAFDGMRAGDKTAKKVVKRYLEYLAAGIVNAANIFRPDVVLLGGGVSKEGETLLKPLKKMLARDLYGGGKYAPVALACASLGNDAGIFGAAHLAMPE